jgi:hypothetical protein
MVVQAGIKAAELKGLIRLNMELVTRLRRLPLPGLSLQQQVLANIANRVVAFKHQYQRVVTAKVST